MKNQIVLFGKSINDFSFDEESGINADVPADANPVFFFKILFTSDFVDNLVTITSKYANKFINLNRPLRCSSMWNSWKDIDFDKMRKFIELISSMGLIFFPSYKK